MSIQEQIVAFLDGELTDETALSELMHVLAVSPEKRAFLVAQSRLTRLTSALTQSIVPAASADAAIMAGIASIDNVRPALEAPAVPPSATSGSKHSWQWGGLAILPFVGLLVGYLLWGGETPYIRSGASVMEASALSGMAPIGAELRTSLREIHRGVAGELGLAGALVAATSPLRIEVDRLRTARAKLIAAIAWVPRLSPDRPSIATAPSRIDPLPMPETIELPARMASLHRSLPRPFHLLLSRPAGTVHPAPPPPSSQSELRPADAVEKRDLRQVSVGVRNILRLSLPRIYGIPAEQSIVTDREITFGLRLDEGILGLRSPLTVGASIGETRFAQSFRRHEGGSSVSSVIEQTPGLLYARGWIAPQLLSTDGFSGHVDLGGGSTSVGPFATIGLGAEYRPIDVLSMDFGVASWILFSQLDAQNVISANLNSHVGASIWF